jgi:hypothetical protein
MTDEDDINNIRTIVAALTNKPKPVWVTVEEGGDYIPWDEWTVDWNSDDDRRKKLGYTKGWKVFSVGFDNGWVFDNYGGWRSRK